MHALPDKGAKGAGVFPTLRLLCDTRAVLYQGQLHPDTIRSQGEGSVSQDASTPFWVPVTSSTATGHPHSGCKSEVPLPPALMGLPEWLTELKEHFHEQFLKGRSKGYR